MNLNALKNISDTLPKTPRLPVLFVGHGSPQNALEDNEFTREWKRVGSTLPTPAAVLCISAHWFVDGTYVHGSAKPQTIHDFYGFAPELYNIQYPCPGAPEAARATQGAGKSTNIKWDLEWGLDHGCWVVLSRMFPGANIPVYQMSLDYTKPSEWHYTLAQDLAVLREHGVLVVASGNIVHNLGLITFDEIDKPYDWALEFDATSKKLIADDDHQALVHYQRLGPAAHHSIPSPDHYWPMLYALGLQQKGEDVKFFAEGITFKSISMRSFIIQ